MGVTVQVRNLDSSTRERLGAIADGRGVSLSELLRLELPRLADILEVRRRVGGPYPELSKIDMREVVDLIREDRDR